MPVQYHEYWAEWQRLNPEAELMTWTEEEIFNTKWHNQRIIDKMLSESMQPGADMISFYTHVADVICQEIMYRFGGFYTNCDMLPIKPLTELDLSKPGFAMEDDIHSVNMAMWGMLGAEPVFRDIVHGMKDRYFGNPGSLMNFTTGALYMTEIVNSYGNRVNKWHKNMFNPIHFSQIEYGTAPDLTNFIPPKETVCIHTWGHRLRPHNQRILEEGW
jgi:mannosyltransferase OCH1-like enzyme